MTNHIELTKRMIEVMQAYVDGEKIETCYGIVDNPWWMWDYSDKYRIIKTPDQINWDHVAPEFKYMARDESGIGYIYNTKPILRDDVWSCNDFVKLTKSENYSSYKRGTVDWKDSLVIRPGCE